MRYRRYKRRYSGTRAIKMKFQSFMDINTSNTSMQIITVSAGGRNVLSRLRPQFSAYKYYRLGTVSVKLVPASTLPVDPTGLSYESGEPGVDPRDQLTPGLMRITNGEDIFEDISGMDADTQHKVYNNMMLDPRWFKWMLQAGVKRYATPRFWQIGQLHQDKWPGAQINIPAHASASSTTPVDTETLQHAFNIAVGGQTFYRGGSSPYGFFQTGHSGVLGWLPTDALQSYLKADFTKDKQPFLASPPEVEVFKIILPKAFKTKYYYRMFITETVYFRDPIVTYGIGNSLVGQLDVFQRPSAPTPTMPGTPGSSGFPSDADTGGNYGSD